MDNDLLCRRTALRFHKERRLTGRHLQSADGLRGFACLLVLTVHTVAITFPASLVYLSGCAKIGVWLFFVLSAFLITYQLEQRGFRIASLIDYSAGRFLRIIPAFAIAVLFYRYFGTAGIDTWGDVKAALLFEKGYSHLWTIPVEFKAYALIPFVAAAFLALRRFTGTNGIVLGLFLTIAIHQWFFPYRSLDESSIATIWYLPSFLIGSAAAALLPEWRRLPIILTSTIAWIALAIVVVVTPVFWSFVFGWLPNDILMNKFLYFSAIWGLFTLSVIANDNRLRRLFSRRVFSALGSWSYSVYLLHWYFLVTMSSWSNRYLAALFGFTASILAGVVMHWAIEGPCEKARKWLRNRLETKFPNQTEAEVTMRVAG